MKKVTTAKKIIVTVDDNIMYKAYTFGVTWNGWQCPYFEAAEADRIAKDCEGVFNQQKNAYEFPSDDEEDLTPYSYEAEWITTEDGEKEVYAIGSHFWIWDEVNFIEALAVTFAVILKEWLTPEEFEEMVTLNNAETNSEVCHSHDHCDSNQAVLDAYARLTGIDVDAAVDTPQWDIISEVTGKAWDIAKANQFYINQ